MSLKSIATTPSVLAKPPTPVFLAGYNSEGELTLHVCSGRNARAVELVRAWAKSQAGPSVPVSVRAHQLKKLAHPRSLEHWLDQLDIRDVLHDPTMIVSRARGLLLIAKSCRSVLGKLIEGSFFDPARRTLFVLARSTFDNMVMSSLRLRIAEIVQEAWNRSKTQFERGSSDSFFINVSVVDRLPGRKLIPVDYKSASLVRRMARTVRRWLALTTMALAMGAAAIPAEAKLDTGLPSSGPFSTLSSTDEFGMLAGLSVFADGQRSLGSDAFSSGGLSLYFGPGGRGILVAQSGDSDDLLHGNVTDDDNDNKVSENDDKPTTSPKHDDDEDGDHRGHHRHRGDHDDRDDDHRGHHGDHDDGDDDGPDGPHS